VLDEVDVIYGIHLWSLFPTGEIHCAPGEIMATAEEFQIEIQGRGGHAAQPHKSVDALLTGAQLVLNLQTIVSRNMDPIESCVVTIGQMQSGKNFNIIADTCSIKGTVRTFKESMRALAERRVHEIATHTAALYGATATVDYKGGFSSVVNDEYEAARCTRVSTSLFGKERTRTLKPIMAGEDFAFYLEKKPGCFIFVGAGNQAKECVYDHHHPKFDFDEDALPIAGRLMIAMVLDYMNDHA
jgi:amidohydrolase